MQAYHENIKTEHEDSYAEIQCNVCHNMSNQTLLLQCDLCDSSSHATAPFNVNKVTNVEEHQVDGQAKVLSDAKSEIQTLVKLNLKLSNAQKKLGMALTCKQHL